MLLVTWELPRASLNNHCRSILKQGMVWFQQYLTAEEGSIIYVLSDRSIYDSLNMNDYKKDLSVSLRQP